MQAILYSVSALLFLALFIVYVLAKKGLIKFNIDLYVKILSYILIGVFILRYMWQNNAIQNTFKLQNEVFDNKATNAYVLILNWIMYSVILLMCMYPFFKNIKGLEVLIKYYVLPFSIVGYASFFLLGRGIVGEYAFVKFDIRLVFMAIEFGLLLASSFIVFFEKGKFKTSLFNLKMLWFIIPALLAVLPPYLIQGLFGYQDTLYELKDLSLPHRFLIYGSIVLPFIIHFWLKKRDKKFIKFALLYISLGTLLSFSFVHRFPTFTDVTGWPIHLCNTAMYIIPLCIMFKWDKLFYFTYFINVLGAFLAMAMPNYSAETNLYSASCIRFFINHYIAFFMPLLMVSLRIYQRPKLKQFKYSMVGFAIYFAIVLICNAWFSNYGTVDYFFVNSDFIAEKLGQWAENLRNVVLQFNIGSLEFVFYPVYQVIFLLVYVLLGLGMWFIYEQGYAFADVMSDIVVRNRKIKADYLALQVSKVKEENEMLDKKEVKETTIILNNFSKRYGSSKHYAVKDANLKVMGGEVFGFLGHNGAGKSTIIKSIVGIQPITSGSISVCGYDVDKESVMAKQLIGFVPDHYALYEKLTGREYINYIADLYGVSTEDRNVSIKKYVKIFELNEAFDNQIKTYSHGMKQKIAIMSALVHNPKVWILDEPLTGLDPTSIFQVKQCMKEHAKAGNIVFFSSHLIDVVESICDKIAIIKKGEILTTKSLKEIEAECTLEEFYLKTIETKTEDEVEKQTEQNEVKAEN